MRIRSTWLAVIVVALLAMTALTACGPTEEEVDVPDDPDEVVDKRGGTLVIGMGEEPNILDPHKTGAAASYFIMALIGDPMVDQDPVTADFIPGIAESWEISDDGLELTLYLRDDVVFHEGKPFTAHDLKATWDRAFHPDTETVLADGILGPMEEITVIDDYTLHITMERPFGPLLGGFASTGYTHIIDPDRLDEYGEDYGRNPASTGPYRFEEWVTGQHITLVRNEDYAWPREYYDNQGPPYPDRMKVMYILESATRVAALETGDLDISAIPSTEVYRFKDHPDFDIYTFLASGVNMAVWFNHDSEILEDVRVRQAINHAIDKSAIIDAAIDGYGIEAHGPIPPTITGYWDGVEDLSYKYDFDRAAELLDDAGWVLPEGEQYREKDGEVLELSLYIMPADAWIITSEMVQAQCRAIGIKVEIESYEWGTLMEYLSEGRHDMHLMGYGYGDMDILYMCFHSDEAGPGLNWAFLRDPAIDAAVEGQRYTVDPDERASYAQEAQRLIVEGAAWAPIYTVESYVAVNKRVQGFRVNYRGSWLLHDVWLETE